MPKKILITGSTDGIGLETAKTLISQGHQVLLHGRNPDKLNQVVKILSQFSADGNIESYLADLSDMHTVRKLSDQVIARHDHLDILINNAGVLKSSNTVTRDDLDVRLAVNTLAPYYLTQQLFPIINRSGRIINLSSAAQSPVNLNAVVKHVPMPDMDAYSQSKLAITMWSIEMGRALKNNGPTIVAVNPGSLLATKMVKEGFGFEGHDIRIGADILVRAALSDEFDHATGRYFDNDTGQFAEPHPDALDSEKTEALVRIIDAFLANY